MIKEIRSEDDAVRMTVEFPDELSEEDREEIIEKLQSIVDLYGSVDELAAKFEEVANTLNLTVWKTH